MKWLGILLAALLAVAPGYGQAQPQGKESPPAAPPKAAEVKEAPAPPAVKGYTPKERKEYEKKIAADLAKLRDRIGELKTGYTKAAPQMKRTLRRELANLDRQAIAAENKLADWQKASENDWNSLKAEMDKAMEELKTACAGAESRLQ